MLFFAISCPMSADDHVIDAYLRPIAERVEREQPSSVLLCGGEGHRFKDTLPRRMFEWFVRYYPAVVQRLCIIDHVRNVHDMVHAVIRYLHEFRLSCGARVSLFCEASHARELQEYLAAGIASPARWRVEPIVVSAEV